MKFDNVMKNRRTTKYWYMNKCQLKNDWCEVKENTI